MQIKLILITLFVVAGARAEQQTKCFNFDAPVLDQNDPVRRKPVPYSALQERFMDFKSQFEACQKSLGVENFDPSKDQGLIEDLGIVFTVSPNGTVKAISQNPKELLETLNNHYERNFKKAFVEVELGACYVDKINQMKLSKRESMVGKFCWTGRFPIPHYPTGPFPDGKFPPGRDGK